MHLVNFENNKSCSESGLTVPLAESRFVPRFKSRKRFTVAIEVELQASKKKSYLRAEEPVFTYLSK